MAFVAGVILMYLPEEPAFRVLCQLLDGSGQLTIQGLYKERDHAWFMKPVAALGSLLATGCLELC